MWRAVVSAVTRRSSRRQVGSDRAGNTYYLEEEGNGVKRVMDYAGDTDPSTVPVEWLSWLAGRRADPPTLQDQDLMALRRAQIQEKVLELEAEDAALRIQERRSGYDQRAVDVTTMHLEHQERNAALQAPSSSSSPSPSPSAAAPSPSPQRHGGAPAAAADETADDRQHQRVDDETGEAQGTGSSFRVGTWTPGG